MVLGQRLGVENLQASVLSLPVSQRPSEITLT